jgi:hypothetical protein
MIQRWQSWSERHKGIELEANLGPMNEVWTEECLDMMAEEVLHESVLGMALLVVNTLIRNGQTTRRTRGLLIENREVVAL